MSKHFGSILDPQIHTSTAMFGQIGDISAFIGAWSYARPSTTATGAVVLPGLPSYAFDVDAPAHVRADTIRGNGLLAVRPLDCHAAFQYARSLVIELHKREHELAGKGYNVPARIDGLKRDIDSALKDLGPFVASLRAADEAADKAAAAAATTFPATAENEMAVVMNDAAICARLGDLTAQDKQSLGQGELSPRLADPRITQALQRVPLAASGLDADTLARISAAYARRYQPATTEAVDTLRQMIEAARATCTGAILACARLGGRIPTDVFASILSGDWLEARVAATGISTAELRRLIEAGRTAAPV